MKIKRKMVLVCLLGVGLALAGCGKAGESPRALKWEHKIEIGGDDRLLVVAPHPDDETLGPAGVIKRAVAAGATVKVVVVTCGDGYKKAVQANLKTLDPGPEQFRELGVIRHEESQAAMKTLGVAEQDVVFLGYPDGGTNGMWFTEWDTTSRHQGLNGATSVPYEFAFRPGAPYSGQSVVDDLTSIIAGFQPTVVIYPDAEDYHHDHWAVNAFVQYSLVLAGVRSREYNYLVHRGLEWPRPYLYLPNGRLAPPSQLEMMDVTWLDPPTTLAQRAKKHEAVGKYHSQIIVMAPFLLAFVRRNELFERYPDTKMTRVSGQPDLAKSDLPGRIVVDQTGTDLLRKLAGAEGDITTVWAMADGERIWLVLALKGGVSPDLRYAFHFRSFAGEEVKRLDVVMKDGKVTVPLSAANSIGEGGEMVYKTYKNRAMLGVPLALFGDATTLMVNVDSYDGSSDVKDWLDRTGWRRLII